MIFSSLPVTYASMRSLIVGCSKIILGDNIIPCSFNFDIILTPNIESPPIEKKFWLMSIIDLSTSNISAKISIIISYLIESVLLTCILFLLLLYEAVSSDRRLRSIFPLDVNGNVDTIEISCGII